MTDDKLDLGPLRFKPEDFYNEAVIEPRIGQAFSGWATEVANELLAARLKAHGVRMHFCQQPGPSGGWHEALPCEYCTRAALLILPRKLGET